MFSLLFILSQISVIACSLVGGVFLAFSDFIMRSLDRSDRAAGIQVMQTINIEVYKYVFMFLLIGMSALSPFLIALALLYAEGPAATLIVSAGVIYLAGVLAVTGILNVPMNNRLALEDHTATKAAAYWSAKYYPHWTFWNYVRAICATVSATLYLFACLSIVAAI